MSEYAFAHDVQAAHIRTHRDLCGLLQKLARYDLSFMLAVPCVVVVHIFKLLPEGIQFNILENQGNQPIFAFEALEAGKFWHIFIKR